MRIKLLKDWLESDGKPKLSVRKGRKVAYQNKAGCVIETSDATGAALIAEGMAQATTDALTPGVPLAQPAPATPPGTP